MTPEERQALREKHAEQYGLCVFCFLPYRDLLGHTLPALYPCDTIEVLDAWEANTAKALDALDKINTMRVDEDDFEWLQTAEFTLKGEL